MCSVLAVAFVLGCVGGMYVNVRRIARAERN